MDRQLFIEKFKKASPGLNMEHIDRVVSGCLDRCHDKFPSYERGHMNMVSAMEEMGELSQAISQKMRERTNDNYDILQEAADVILSIWCICEILGITHEDLQKAINVKTGREAGRILEHENKMKSGYVMINGAFWDNGRFDREDYLKTDGSVPDYFTDFCVTLRDGTPIRVWARNVEEALIIADGLENDNVTAILDREGK